MKNGLEDFQFENCVTRPYFSILFLCFLKKRKSLTLFTPCMLINKELQRIFQTS